MTEIEDNFGLFPTEFPHHFWFYEILFLLNKLFTEFDCFHFSIFSDWLFLELFLLILLLLFLFLLLLLHFNRFFLIFKEVLIFEKLTLPISTVPFG